MNILNLGCTAEFDMVYSREHDGIREFEKSVGNAGYDLYVDPVWFKEKHNGIIALVPGETVLLSTGLRIGVPNEWYGQVFERGSTGTKAMKYGAGVIDSSFNGIVQVVITNASNGLIILANDETMNKSLDMMMEGDIVYNIEKAVAQMVFLPVPKVNIKEVCSCEIINRESERGEAMLGSTNKK